MIVYLASFERKFIKLVFDQVQLIGSTRPKFAIDV